ncbi:hypothetical protein [Meiothermus hypogaeus]|uniref:Uncharacterized protein n=2 Tax=Meiothermus hypogaeus TaxID=884155 RepID=A0A511R3Q3_9DEIN|nr:hypothetical protein [Meiothermus hypogaeus]RIH78445.1 hypothetical protein Mhypo_01573 [Meiothermus hypogaeus]GEM84239.1 hypothetical protein MHY01S_24050 [Meiothermus hypogaeus NBRC 106114]GIW35858.1 MAG: hypothetical protein KatS3mg073_0003 [Meiothermus sp.]
MSKTRTYLLQLWQDPYGLWAVLKDEAQGQLHQFESLEALTQFLSQIGDDAPLEPPGTPKEVALGLE